MNYSTFVIAIPSHDRCELIQKYALNFIQKYNLHTIVPIYIFCTPGQINDYKSLLTKYPYLKIVAGDHGLSLQRNFIRDYFDTYQKILYIDDDMEDLIFCNSFIFHKPFNLYKELHNIFIYMEKMQLYLAGVSPSGNTYFLTNQINSGAYFAVGCCYFEINRKHPILYRMLSDEYIYHSECEDFKNTFNHILFNWEVLRLDYIGVKHKYNKNKGGMNNNNISERFELRKIIGTYLATEFPTYFKLMIKKPCKTIPYERTEPRVKRIHFENVFLKKYTTGTMPGMYYTAKGTEFITLNPNKNYNLYEYDCVNNKNNLLAIVLRDILRPDTWHSTLYKKLDSWSKKQNSNRSDIAGVLDIDKLPKSVKKYIETKNINFTDIKTNTNKTRIQQRSEFSQDICNIYNCITLGYYNGKKLSQYDKKINDLNLDGAFMQMLQPLDNIYNKVLSMHNIEPLDKYIYRNTCFNAITINKSGRSANHKDSNNTNHFAMLFHVNSPFESNNFSGGDILFPEYKVSMNMRPNKDIVLFDSKNIFHCNDVIYNDDDTQKYNSRLSFVLFSK